MVAAIYVLADGPYANLPSVDAWPEERDARKYSGPYPVVAHPPCQRWGRYWFGGPSCKVRKIKGDDNGCFESALHAVRTFGGVLEHPEASHAWAHFGLAKPPRKGGWVAAGDGQGYTCCVEQGHYGHAARKATWLYVAKVTELPHLRWGSSGVTMRLDEGFHSADERRAARRAGRKPLKRLSARQRAMTPLPFRDLLLDIARTVKSL